MQATDTLERLQYEFHNVRRSYAENAARLCRSPAVGVIHPQEPYNIADNDGAYR